VRERDREREREGERERGGEREREREGARESSQLPSERGTPSMILKTVVLKKAQAEARIWLSLTCLCQVCWNNMCMAKFAAADSSGNA
jgi:hypothetical protein